MTGAALLFNPRLHEYRRPDGLRVPSVTQVLKASGLTPDFNELVSQGRLTAVMLEQARELGTAVHQATQDYDDGQIDLGQVPDRVMPFLEAWAMFRANQRLTPLTRERCLYAEQLGLCGTVDGIFVRGSAPDQLILIDIKTGGLAGARLQTAAYEMLWNVEHPDDPIAERWAVELDPGAVVPYRITNFTAEVDSWRDAHYFHGYLQAYHHHQAGCFSD